MMPGRGDYLICGVPSGYYAPHTQHRSSARLKGHFVKVLKGTNCGSSILRVRDVYLRTANTGLWVGLASAPLLSVRAWLACAQAHPPTTSSPPALLQRASQIRCHAPSRRLQIVLTHCCLSEASESHFIRTGTCTARLSQATGLQLGNSSVSSNSLEQAKSLE